MPSRKSRERERETTRGGTNVLCPVIFLPLLFTTTDIVYSGETEKGSIRSTLISRHHPIGLIGVEPTNFIRRRRIVTFLIRVCPPRRVAVDGRFKFEDPVYRKIYRIRFPFFELEESNREDRGTRTNSNLRGERTEEEIDR